VFLLASFWVELVAVKTDIGGFNRAGMALQRSGTKEIVQRVVGEKNNPEREQLRTGLRRDFVLILSYATLFAALGLLLTQAHVSGARWLGIAAVIFILGAAAFDVTENYKTFEILSLEKTNITDSMCRNLFIISTLKWLLLFLAIGSLAVVLLKLLNWYSFIGVLMALSAIAGVAGLRSHRLITPALITLGFAIIILGIIFIFTPQKILRLIC
jgi:hypothetical protein